MANALKKRWAAVSEAYLDAFCDKMEVDRADAFWVGDEPVALASVGDWLVNIHDIRYVVDKDIPCEVFLRWYDYDLEVGEIELEWRYLCGAKRLRHINLKAWCQGAPLPYSEEELKGLKLELKKMDGYGTGGQK